MSQSERYIAWVHSGSGPGVAVAIICCLGTGLAGVLGVGYVIEHPLIVFPTMAAAGFVVGKVVAWVAVGGSGRVAQTIYMPGAAGTYSKQYSHIDTLEARGDARGAASAWDAVAVAEPRNSWALIRAGELYFRKLNEPALALERFRHARDLPGVGPEHHRYATLKIVDLYLGPLADPGRALVELRRLVEHHPGTREAGFAREAIAKLKADLSPEP